MSKITLTPDDIEVSFTRAERITGLVRDQTIPRSAVTDVTIIDDGLSATKGLRAPGLGLPRRRKLGTWRRPGRKELVDVRHGEPTLRLSLTGHAYQAALLGTPDGHTLARQLSGPPQ